VWGFAPDPVQGAYSAVLAALTRFRKSSRKRKGEKVRKGKGEVKEGVTARDGATCSNGSRGGIDARARCKLHGAVASAAAAAAADAVTHRFILHGFGPIHVTVVMGQ